MAALPTVEREGSEFADFQNFRVEYRDASHRYWIHTKDYQTGELIRTPVPSVTTAIKVMDKPALVHWAEGVGAEAAVRLEREGELAGCPPAEAIERIRGLNQGTRAKRDAGGDKGAIVHAFIESYMANETIDFDAVTPLARPYVAAAAKWLMEQKPTILRSEFLLGSSYYRYAGKPDLIARVGGRTVLVDFKTSPKGGIYREAHIQAAGYKGMFDECGVDPVEGVLLVSFNERGEYEQVSGKGEFEDFLACLELHKRLGRLEARLKE